MMQFKQYLQRGPAMLAMAAALAACGGGGGGGGGAPSTPAPPPATTAVATAAADVATASLNKSATLAVLANDSVTNGGTLALISTSAPAHGTATISGTNVVYTPAAGFIGKDSFTYMAGSGLATSSAQVSVTVSADLTLAGRAADLPPNSSVTVAVGAATSTVSTDASGNFSAPVKLDTPASMITITAQGTGAQAGAKLISLVGDSQLAITAAGSGSTLTPANLPGLNVTSLTTALYAQASRQNGDVAPATQAALDEASAKVGASELLQMAALVRSITGSPGVAPRRALPAGAADTLALVGNAALYTQLVRQIAPSSLVNEIGLIYGAPGQAAVPSIAVASSQALTLYGNESCCALAAQEVVLNADGSASVLKDQQRVAGTWRRDANALTVTLATPVVRSEFVDGGTVPPTLVEVQSITGQFVLRQISGSADHGFMTMAQAGTIHYPGGQRADGSFESHATYAFSEWARLAAPGDIAGSTLGGVPDPVNLQAAGVRQLLLALAADGSAGSAQLPGLAASWKSQNGKLVVDYGGGRIQSMARVSAAANGEERWLARTAMGSDYAVHEFTVARVQGGLAFSEASAASRWRSHSPLSEIGPEFYMNLLPTHQGQEQRVDLDGSLTLLGANSWALDNGTLVISSYLLPDGSVAGSCPAGQTCILRSEHTWTLLRNDAAGVFVFEKSRFSATDIRYRVIRYER